ncbi:MAG: CARDB domain-containing protein, partial [Bacteroidales bacterium]|nr:CARDB domain-containing protein [Bacteroidales bacterium]MDZ4203624.1 CARDB domain-containing protein [Bacteroidales bacterium]
GVADSSSDAPNSGTSRIFYGDNFLSSGGTSGSRNLESRNRVDGELTTASPVSNTLASLQITVSCATGSSWNSTNSKCEAIALPDLTFENITPITAIVGVSTSYSATLSNTGNASTVNGFSNFFQVATSSGGGGTITDLTSATTTALGSGLNRTINQSYTLNAGTFSMRACADKTNRDDSGTIPESNENNNCGEWTDIEVLPAPVVPTVTTPTVTNITSSGATLGANVTSLGNPASITAKGTCWTVNIGEEQPFNNIPTTNNSCTPSATGMVTGIFTQLKTGMLPNTSYWYQGYATNHTGTGYSSVELT